MDSELVYSMVGIVGFLIVIYLTLRSANKKINVKTKGRKKDEIVSEYKTKLRSALAELSNDQEARLHQKTLLIKEYNNELSRNIFFDENEVKEIVVELSQM